MVFFSASPTSDNNFLRRWASRMAFLCAFIPFLKYLDSIRQNFYIFEPGYLHEVAKAAIAASPENDIDAMMHYIVANLTETYPQDSSASILLNLDTEEWMFNNHGGAMGAMYIIHASITEYLIIYGTPLGTEGHTGIHTADDYFNILVGEEWLFSPPNLTMTVYKPGDLNLMPRGSSPKQYKMHKGCFALEYARGWIPPMLPFGYADSFTSTLDFFTLWRTTRITGREMLRNLLIGKI